MIQMQDQDVSLDKIDPPRTAARESIDAEKLGDLADDLGANGLLQRVGLIGPDDTGRYEVVWGDRRTRAARLLHWTTIAARVAPHGTDPVIMRAAENHVREQLNPREEAKQIQGLLEAGKSVPEIRRILRRSEFWIEQRLALLDWPPDIQDAVAAGALSLAVARLLVNIDHDGYRQELVREAIRTGATARTAAVWTAAYGADRERFISNNATVEQMLERREMFTPVCACESCGTTVDLRRTRLLRICNDCNDELVKAQLEQQRQEHNGTPAR